MATGNDSARVRVLVMGHSYVHWLERFAADQSKLPNSRNLLFDQCDVVYIGVRGATVDKLRSQSNLREVRRLSPDVVILHVGGNDIDQGVAPQMIGMQVYQLARELIRLDIKRVIVCQVIRRNQWRHLVYDEGVKSVSDINEFLMAACDGDYGVSFWKHRSELFRQDGVHLNELGNIKFIKSIKGAILQAITICARK